MLGFAPLAGAPIAARLPAEDALVARGAGALPGLVGAGAARVGGSFLVDPTALRVYLVEAWIWDRAAGAEVPVHLATRDITFAPGTAPSIDYDGRITGAPSIKREMYRDGAIGGRSLPSYGALTIRIDDTLRDDGRLAAWRRAAWQGRRVRLLAGIDGAPYSSYVTLLDGVATGALETRGVAATLPIGDVQARLGRQAFTTVYPEGASGGVGGRLQPVVLGQVRGAPPVYRGDGWWDLSPEHGLHSVQGVYDGAGALTETASNPPAFGHFFADLASGRIRTADTDGSGGATYGLSVDCRGAFGAGAVTAPALCDALWRHMGVDARLIDGPGMAAAVAAFPAAVGAYVTTARTGVDLVDLFVGSFGGRWSSTRRGRLSLGRLTPPTATAPTDAPVVLHITDADYDVAGESAPTITTVAAPPWRWDVGCRRNWAGVSSFAELDQTTASPERIAFAQREVDLRTADSPETLLADPDSEPLRRDTALDDPADAQVLADWYRDTFSRPQAIATVPLATQPYVLDLGDEVWWSSAQHGVDAPWRVIGTTETATGATVTLWTPLD